jgi:SAM-dependent methyltransferase
MHPPPSEDRVIDQQRNFFGVLRVLEANQDQPRLHRMKLRNGSTLHGSQHVTGSARRAPVSYFGRLTGVGLVMGLANQGRPWRVGVIGLGIGTLAAYGRNGDRMVFYELDPDVMTIAQTPNYFSYLGDSAAEIEVILGDARLSLEAELQAGRERDFDLLVVDAFNSDAIPVHLLTREAFQVYKRHLRTGGALALHVSNRHFNFAPLVFRLGRDMNLRTLAVINELIPAHLSTNAWWLILSEDIDYLESVVAYGRRQMKTLGVSREKLEFARLSVSQIDRAPVWTDDYSDLFTLLTNK